jgi:hypothetical protein
LLFNDTPNQVCTLACSAAVISDCEAQAATSGFKSVLLSSCLTFFLVFIPLSFPSARYELPPVFNGRGGVPPLKFDRASGKFQLRM